MILKHIGSFNKKSLFKGVKMAHYAGVKPFFFESMKKILTEGIDEGSIAELPKSKCFIVKGGPFQLIYLCNEQKNKITANIFIYEDESLAWSMNFHGYYKDPARPFLKKILVQEYSQQIDIQPLDLHDFHGCRGPRVI